MAVALALVHETDKWDMLARQQQQQPKGSEDAFTDAKLSCRNASIAVVGQLVSDCDCSGQYSGQYAWRIRSRRDQSTDRFGLLTV